MTERDADSGERHDREPPIGEPADGGPTEHELEPPADSVSPERRALADAIRDALTSRPEAPERGRPPVRAPAAESVPHVDPDSDSSDGATAEVSHDDEPGESGIDVGGSDGRDSDVGGSDGSGSDRSGSDSSERGAGEPEVVGLRAGDADAGDRVAGDPDAGDRAVGEISEPAEAEPTEAEAEDAEPEDAEPAGDQSEEPDRGDTRVEHGETDRDAPGDGPAPESEPESTPAVPTATVAAPEEASSLEAMTPPDGEKTPRRRISRRGAVAIGTRALTGAIGVLVAVGAIVAATVVPDPRLTTDPRDVVVDPVPAAQQRVCPGPLLRLGDDEGQGASTASSVGRAASVFQASPRNPDADFLRETENTAGVAPQVLTLPPGGSEGGESDTPVLAGSQTQAVDSGDLVGLAAAECVEPSGDTWLVGGSTDVGRTTLITLSNPTTVTATVDLSIFGPTGEVPAPGSQGIVVQPGVQRIFSLAGFAPQLPAPVVRATSRGGLIVANLQQTTVRTLEPGGIDIVGATAPPAGRVVIPGVVVGAASAVTEAQGREGYDDLQTTLRMFTPGVEPTTATITITSEEDQAAPEADDSVAVEGGDSGTTGFEVPLGAGEVTEVPVPGLADGSYTVTIEADEPFVAAARVSTIGDAGSDFTWLPGARPLAETTLLSVAFGPAPVLHLVNRDDSDRSVTLTSGDDAPGDGTEIAVGAGESVDTPLTAGADVRLVGTSGLLATITYDGDGQLAAFGLTAPGPASTPITVYR